MIPIWEKIAWATLLLSLLVLFSFAMAELDRVLGVGVKQRSQPAEVYQNGPLIHDNSPTDGTCYCHCFGDPDISSDPLRF